MGPIATRNRLRIRVAPAIASDSALAYETAVARITTRFRYVVVLGAPRIGHVCQFATRVRSTVPPLGRKSTVSKKHIEWSSMLPRCTPLYPRCPRCGSLANRITLHGTRESLSVYTYHVCLHQLQLPRPGDVSVRSLQLHANAPGSTHGLRGTPRVHRRLLQLKPLPWRTLRQHRVWYYYIHNCVRMLDAVDAVVHSLTHTLRFHCASWH